MYNGTKYNPLGRPKINAWKWLIANYGTLSVLWIIIFIVALWATPYDWSALTLSILLIIPILLIIYVPKWYRELVNTNYLLPLSKSPFKAIFRKEE